MTVAYAVQGPQSNGILPVCFDLVPKWTHSVLQEATYSSEWDAAHRATELALQFGNSTFHPPCTSPKTIRKFAGTASVRFCPLVGVFIGEDDSLCMSQVTVIDEVLSSASKPWSGRCICPSQMGFQSNFDYDRDLGCSVSSLFRSFASVALNSDKPAMSIPEGDCLQLIGADNSLATGFDVHATQALSDDVSLSKSCPFVAPDFTAVIRSDPLSEVAVLIPDIQAHGKPFEVSTILCHECRTTVCPAGHAADEPSSNRETSAPADANPSAPGRSGSPIRLPPFAQQMMVNLPLEFLTNPIRIVQGFLVRSWYLHHVNIPRSLQARQIMLTGPPHLWRAQILTLWADFIIPCEDLTLDLVQPAPPRNWHERSIVFDLILSQGLYVGRFAGLVTVSPTITEPSLRMYAVAVSFASVISGQDVITDTDVQPFCNRFDCLVFHAQTQLYIDFNPVHRMQHGDSFVIYLSRKVEPAQPSPSESVAALDPAPEPAVDSLQPMEIEVDQSISEGPGADAPPPVTAIETPDERRRITLYSLNRPSKAVWVRWKHFSHLLHDVIEASAIVPAALVAIHPLLIKPVGELAHELSVIVQLHSDIAPGSSETLILLDTVFHQQGPTAQSFAAPAYDRKVVKVPLPLTRQGLLHYARVANFCGQLQTQCLVSANYDLWNVQSPAAKSLLHGSYCHIQVPPARTHGFETCRAVSLVEDFFDSNSPTFAQIYPALPHHTQVNDRNPSTMDGPGLGADRRSYRHVAPRPKTHHSADTQQVSAPTLTIEVPAQAAPVMPNVPDWQSFQLDLEVQFDDYSVVEIPEEGPVVHVTTWFIHHDRNPICLIGRLVRLSNRPFEWMPLLCAPWVHLLQPFENVAFRIVRPSPVSNIPGLPMMHIIIEQGLQQARFTALFSVIFQGLHGDVTHRRAQSIPTELSRDTITRILGIDDLCRARHCTAWSGRQQFQERYHEPVFSGIGVCLTVDVFRNRYTAVPDDGIDLDEPASSSSRMPRMSFRADDATLFPTAEMARSSDCDVVVEHTPSRLVPELTIIWQQYLMSTTERPYRFYVETWFCDHDRFPRTNRGREVLLSPDPDTWKQTILDKWRDIIDPSADAMIYVVTPQPIGGPGEVLAHVLVAQHQHRGFVSALITTLAPGDDIWDPPRVALKLPSVVDKGLLLQESGLFLFCPPFLPFNDCTATSGEQVIFQDALVTARSGNSYLCTVETPHAATIVLPEDFMPSDEVHSSFDMLAACIAKVTTCVVSAINTQDHWRNEVDALIHSLDDCCQDIFHFVLTFLLAHDLSMTVPPSVVATTPLVASSASTHKETPFYGPVPTLTGFRPPIVPCLMRPLIELWSQVRNSSSGNEGLTVTVWYVDQLRAPNCTEGRTLRLRPPFDQWSRALVMPWIHEIWPHSEVQFFLVCPVPASSEPAPHAHVLLLQHPVPGLCAVMFSLPHANGSQFWHELLVLSVPAQAGETELKLHLQANTHVRCLQQISTYVVMHGSNRLNDGGADLSHATCLTIVPFSPDEPWLGLTDAEFAALLQTWQKDHSQSTHGRAPQESNPKGVLIPGSPVVLSLDAVIPRTRLAPNQPWQEQLSTLAWFQEANWKDHIADSLMLRLQPLPAQIDLTDASFNALHEALEGTIGPYELIEVYVDGATSATAASWSVVVIVHSAKSMRLLGTLAGPVILGNQSECWTGAVTCDNIAAELSSMIAAMAITLQAQFPCPVHIRPDLSLSRLIAQELVTTVSNPTLAKLCRALFHWVPPTVTVAEVRGHSGHPWNDLADSLAKHVLTFPELYPPVSFGHLHDLVRAPHDLEWTWTQEMPLSMQHCFPNSVQGSVWQFSPSMRKVPIPQTNVMHNTDPVKFTCKTATINVLALDKIDSQTEVGRRSGARTMRLDIQLHAAQFHLVGLQETRTIQGRFASDHYVILSSGGVEPNAQRLGCELWLHRTLPIFTLPDGSTITFSDCKCIVKFADPRRLFVQIEHEQFQLTAIVLHAPCLGKATGDASAPIDVITKWWAGTSQIWHDVVNTDMVCAFVDANATLASATTDFFQEYHSDATTAQSLVFEEFLVDHALFVPSTFKAYHVGPSFTWTHSNGRRIRIDFVLVNQKLFDMVVSSFAWTDYDGTFAHEDHIPACLTLQGWLPGAKPQCAPKWDDLALLDPHRCHAFQEALSTLPLPAWEVSTDSHSDLYEKQFMQLAKQFFLRRPGSRRRPTLQTDTLDAIAFKRHVLDCGRAWGLMTDPAFKHELKELEKCTRRLVCRDLQIHYDQILVQLQEAGHLSDHKQMFRMLARLGGRKHKQKSTARPLPLLHDQNGVPAASFAHQQKIWMEQFSKIEAGLHISLQALQRSDSQGLGLAKDLQEASVFPTDWNLQTEIAKFKRGKMPGPNGITPCLLKAAGSILTKQFAALTLKTAAHGKEPTSWKGGRLAPLHKGKDPSTDPAAYRAIYISDYTSKLYHKMLRQQIEVTWMQNMDLLQLGGRKKLGADIAHHMLEAHQFWCKSRKVSSAIVFFDLRAAFYSVLRQALLNIDLDPTALVSALSRMGVSSEMIQAWFHQATEDHALIDANPHLEKLVHDCMSNTFFSFEGVPGVCKTTRGTRPGDPLGDLLFNLIMRLVLIDMHTYIREHCTAHWIGTADACSSFADSQDLPQCAYFDVSFVDDAAVAIHAASLVEIEHVIKVVVEGFHRAAAVRGLDVNFSQGKTEVMWDILGKGARALKERLHDANSQLVWTCQDIEFCLRLSHSYKHLGSWMQVAGSHQREISHRAGQAMQSWGCLARSFYQKKYVGMKAKSIAFQSLSMSRMLYNAHTWTGVHDKTLAHWQQKLRKPIGLMTKALLHGIEPTHVDTNDLFALAYVLPPLDQLHVARLRYLKRLLNYCPQGLWDLLHQMRDQPHSWLHACQGSFAWFLQFYQVSGAPSDVQDLSAWLSYIALDSCWKGRLKKAAKGCLCFRQASAEQNIWLKAFQRRFVSAGGVLPVSQTCPAELWVCDQCQKSFASKKALATHSGRVHGYRRLMKYFAVDNVCNACVKMYNTRKRLIEHLRDATACLQTLQACFPPLPDEDVLAMDAADHETTLALRTQGWGPSKALAPTRKLSGPCLPPAGTVGAFDMLAKWVVRRPTSGSAFHQLQGHTMTPAEAASPQVLLFQEDLPSFVMQSHEGCNVGDGRFALTGLAKETALLHIRTQVFVHFFSGFRRKGDLHDILEHHIFPEGQQLFIISVDMCLQRERGDLASSSSLMWWLNRIRSGQICGAGGGPPCESYSAARLLDGGPPPVRSGTWPDGIPNIPVRAWRQVMVGSRLMRFIIEVFLELVLIGGCSFIEHPQYPLWAQALDPSSVWASLPMRLLKTIKAVGITSFDQCIFGCASRKPTTIIHLRMPRLRHTILQTGNMGRCCHMFSSHEVLAGRDNSGCFKTAIGKVYPPALNAAIAGAITEFVARTFDTSSSQHLPAEFTDLIVNNFVSDDVIQPDYYS